MTNFAIICMSVAVGFVALGGIFTVSLLTAGKKPAPTPPPVVPVTAKGRPLAVCEHCQRTVAVRKGDGMPYAGRHACHKAPETLTEAHAEGMRGQPTTGDNAA
jgi:hypothetical protein